MQNLKFAFFKGVAVYFFKIKTKSVYIMKF